MTGAFKAGDALIFQDVTVHKALPNRTREIRMSFDARFQPVSQPIADTNMVPYSGCGTWEDVYAGWERSDGQYYWNELSSTSCRSIAATTSGAMPWRSRWRSGVTPKRETQSCESSSATKARTNAHGRLIC